MASLGLYDSPDSMMKAVQKFEYEGLADCPPGVGSHVMLVITYVPTKMGPFFRPRYPFGWILKVLSIQKDQNIWTSVYW